MRVSEQPDVPRPSKTETPSQTKPSQPKNFTDLLPVKYRIQPKDSPKPIETNPDVEKELNDIVGDITKFFNESIPEAQMNQLYRLCKIAREKGYYLVYDTDAKTPGVILYDSNGHRVSDDITFNEVDPWQKTLSHILKVVLNEK